MAKRKTNRPSWSDVKAKLSKLDRKQLTGLVADLYRFSRENQDFLHARYGVGEDPLGPYKETIGECMYPDIYTDKPIRISEAKRAISSYSQAVGDTAGEAELMTFFVECGNSFTVNFGDIDEAFYDALILMYQRAIEKVLLLPEDQKPQFRDRLEEIVTSSSGIGWGYHDTLVGNFYSAFPDDE